jgi:type I restriction enzyme, S subunit
MMSLRCGERILPEFLIIILCSDIARKHWLSRAKPAVNQASINQRDVCALPVPVPPDKDEQKVIAKILFALRTQIHRLYSLLEAQQNLKTSLMHELLTGKVRVNNLILEGIATS